jgi:hypothetical protein
MNTKTTTVTKNRQRFSSACQFSTIVTGEDVGASASLGV